MQEILAKLVELSGDLEGLARVRLEQIIAEFDSAIEDAQY